MIFFLDGSPNCSTIHFLANSTEHAYAPRALRGSATAPLPAGDMHFDRKDTPRGLSHFLYANKPPFNLPATASPPLQSRVGRLKKSRRLLTRHPWLGIDWQGREKLKEEKSYSRPFTLGKEEKRPCHPDLTQGLYRHTPTSIYRFQTHIRIKGVRMWRSSSE